MNQIKNKKNKYGFRCVWSFLLLVIFVFMLGGCGNQAKETDSTKVISSTKPTATTAATSPTQKGNQPEQTTKPEQTTQSPQQGTGPEQTTPSSQQVTLLAVGDDLIHQEVIDSGLQDGRDYNYDHLFSVLKNEIEAADISVINQETILGGSDFKYSGYPTFNSPTQIGDAIVKAGFDVVLHATNHTMDKGVKGVENTLEFWKKYPQITVLGINQSEKEQDTIKIVEKNGIKIAMLNYTFGLNGMTLPDNKKYLVNLLDKSKMKADIKKAKKNADFVIVFPHWGTEYKYKPDKKQKELTRFFAEQGVNLVIGTHPHVIEPVTWVKQKNGQKMLVYYSLGNYISYQKKAPRMLGAMAEVTITKTGDQVSISQASVTPIVTHYEKRKDYNFGTFLLSDYTTAQAQRHGVIPKEKNSRFSLEYLKTLSTQVLGDWKKINIKPMD